MLLKVLILAIILGQVHGLQFSCATYNTSNTNNSMYDDFLVDGNVLTQRVVANSSCKETEGRPACYAFWKNGTLNGTTSKPLILKGCWTRHEDCSNKSDCVANYYGNDHYFCCCDSSMCNVKMTLTSEPSKSFDSGKSPIFKVTGSAIGEGHGFFTWKVIMISLLPLVILALVIVTLFFSWRVCRGRIRGESSSSNASIESKDAPLLPTRDSPTPSMDVETILKNIELLEIIAARHSGGCVRKAKLENEMVAVKIFTAQEKLLWEKERDIYNLSGLRCDHQSIPRYIGALKHEAGSKMHEYWLITEYQEMGSLYDFLKSHTVSWSNAIRIIVSACQGLAFLHSNSDTIVNFPTHAGKKLSVAHRDIKSRNILLKNNMTACITDYGLALILDSKIGNIHSQVGTLRYMSPEVLDGTIVFNDGSFFKIDVYALALVMWEVLTRTYTNGIDAADEYKLPFEEKLGLNVKLDSMKQAVVDEGLRPPINDSWREHEGMSLVVDVIEDMWDKDPDARPSAATACHRLLFLLQDERDHCVPIVRNLAPRPNCPDTNHHYMDTFNAEGVQSPKKRTDPASSSVKRNELQDGAVCILSIDTDDDYLVPPLNLKASKIINSGSTPQVMNGYIVGNAVEKMCISHLGQNANKIAPYDNHYPPNITPFGDTAKYCSPHHLASVLHSEALQLPTSTYATTEGFSPFKKDYSELINSSPGKSNHVASPIV